MAESFRVGVTRDFIRPNGELGFGGAGVRLLEETPGIEVTFLPERGGELTPEGIAASAVKLLGRRPAPVPAGPVVPQTPATERTTHVG